MQGQMILFNYFRSSASYRVRIALHLKRIPFKYEAVHLIKNDGEQFSDEYKKLNPLAQVPCLVHNGKPLSQSMAIIQYLDELFPVPLLFPKNSYEKALVIQVCEAFNSGIQPLQNLTVLKELEIRFGASQETKFSWARDWNERVLSSIEKLLEKSAGEFCFGDSPSAADCFLVPHVFSTQRFGVNLNLFPKIKRIYHSACALEAFQMAAPDRQPDFEP